MKYETSSKGAPSFTIWRTSLLFCALAATGLLSSCASVETRQAPNTPAYQDTRSELVFLNIEESSGWVAYNCNEGEAEVLENYRVVVIRQKSGEIIYDSEIPLAADLCTHGFEMAPNDPRLKKLAQNVDSGIIEPLEAYQRALEQEDSVSDGPDSQMEDLRETSEEPVVEESVSPSPEPTAETTKELNTESPSKPVIKIVGKDDTQVELLFIEENSVQVGDRLFLRKPPTYIQVPGTEEDLLTSEGEVTGLVEVTLIVGLRGVAKILSGNVPADGIAEKVNNP